MGDIRLGDEVRDIITGFEGVAIGRLENLFSSTEIRILQRRLNDDGRPMEPLWIEESRLEVKDSLAPTVTNSAEKST